MTGSQRLRRRHRRTYETEEDTLRLLALYNTYKDRTVVINDRHRRLRRGDTLVLGP